MRIKMHQRTRCNEDQDGAESTLVPRRFFQSFALFTLSSHHFHNFHHCHHHSQQIIIADICRHCNNCPTTSALHIALQVQSTNKTTIKCNNTCWSACMSLGCATAIFFFLKFLSFRQVVLASSPGATRGLNIRTHLYVGGVDADIVSFILYQARMGRAKGLLWVS